MAEEIERIYIIPLKKTGFVSSKAAPTAIKRVKKYLTRHMKVEEEKIWIDDSLNNSLWSHGKYNMPTRVRVKAVKFEDGVVEAYLPELEFKKSRRELLREEREKKEPILRKEKEMGEGEEDTGGTKDYDITPTADGDVKIKKKKSTKEKEETAEKETEEKLVKDKIDEKKDEIKEKTKKETSKKKEATSSKKSSSKTKAKKKTDSK
jgi:large subunit ribosomal protein L31e